MRIDMARAAEAMRGLGDALGIDAQRAAFGVHDVVNENMVGAARVAIAERGRVPHEYALMATGGAAPVHAWQVARKLGIRRLVCPPGAGVGSTIGMLMAPARVDRVASLNVVLAAADWQEVARIFARLHDEAAAVVAATGAALSEASARRLADMRYIGQGSEITVALPDSLDAASVREAFEGAYRALFSRTPPGAAIQFVALRLALSAPMPGSGGRLALAPHDGAARKGARQVWFPEAGGFVETAVYDRYALRAGEAIDGPAVFEENESTLIIGPGGRATVLDDGTIDVTL
jgi:N-methylhydantoinase A